jgi:cytochrome c553
MKMTAISSLLGKAAFFLLLGFPLCSLALAGDREAGKTKSTACVACHNLDGNSTNPLWPKIAGQHEGYLFKQLQEFHKGAEGGRNQPVMLGIIGGMSDQDFADLAAYFTAEKMSSAEAPAATAVLGERLYRGGNLTTGVSACSACHGPAGMGNTAAGFPRLAGQHSAYIVDQLKKFRSGERHNDVGGMMQDIAKRMTDAEMQAVADFIQGLHVSSAQ